MKILLAEDDEMIGESLAKSLRQDGYAVNWVKNGLAAQEALEGDDYDLLLLDIGLPKQSGIELLDKLRKKEKSLPVIIISANDTVQDVVNGLDMGADDYLVKPFQLKELHARIRAAMRRNGGRAEPLLAYNGLSLDPATHKITYKKKVNTLSARESALMQALLEKPEAILSRAHLEERIYGWNEEVDSNAIEVHVHNLRRKLGQEVIRNIRGLGYMVGKI